MFCWTIRNQNKSQSKEEEVLMYTNLDSFIYLCGCYWKERYTEHFLMKLDIWRSSFCSRDVFPALLIFRAFLRPALLLSGVSDAAAESRRGRRLLSVWLFRFLHLPGGHGAVCGVFVPRRRSHVGRTHLCIGVLQSEHDIQYTQYTESYRPNRWIMKINRHHSPPQCVVQMVLYKC